MSQLPPETPNPSQTEIAISKRKRGRLDDSLAEPRVANSALPNEVSGVVKRKRGGQPGNTNALKHGRYLAGYRLRNAAAAEVHPPEIDELIERVKISIQHNFEIGMQTDNLAESNQALRSISLAAIGLVRLINLSCKANNSRIASVQDQLSLATSKALIAKYRQSRADAANDPVGSQT